MTLEPKKVPDPYAVDQSEAAAAEERGGSTAETAKTGFSDRVQDGAVIITLEQSNVLDAYEIEKLAEAGFRAVHLGPRILRV